MNKYLIILLAVVVGVMPAVGVLAFYGDTETSVGNEMGASTLDLSLRDLNDVVLTGLLFDVAGMAPEDEEMESLRFQNDGVLDATYGAWSVQTSGDTILCGALQLEVIQGVIPVYNGSLMAFNESPAGDILSGAFDEWEFTVGLDDDDIGLREKSCEFDLVFKGWQQDSDGTWGFTDEERASNEVATGTWGVEPGDVVINEIMWMGSNAVSDVDEWVELKNTTGDAIDLAGWTIERVGSGASEITIVSGIIPAGGYFLVGHYESASSAVSDSITIDVVIPGISLNNDGEVLTLKDSYSNVIDTTPSGVWQEGNNNDTPVGQRNSMERNDEPGAGTSWGDWHTCLDAGCRTTTFWDVEGDDYGTPGATNLSENDPTSVAANVEEEIEAETEGEPAAETEGVGDDDTGTGGTENTEVGDSSGGEEGQDADSDNEEPEVLADEVGSTEPETEQLVIDEEAIIKEENGGGEESGGDSGEEQSGEEQGDDNTEPDSGGGEESGGNEEPEPSTKEGGMEL